MKLFIYGSLLLPENINRFGIDILGSAFVLGYKIKVEPSPITKRNYHYVRAVYTGDTEDVICGYIVSVENIEAIDKWEGLSYKRVLINAKTRTMEDIECYMYINSKST